MRHDELVANLTELRASYREWKAYDADRERLIARYRRGEISHDAPEAQQLKEWYRHLADGQPGWVVTRERIAAQRALARMGDPEAMEDERAAELSAETLWLGHPARNARERFQVHAPVAWQWHRIPRLPTMRPSRRVPLTPRPSARARTRRTSRGSPSRLRPRRSDVAGRRV